jgi:DNA-binding transcriptional ArsR family regulator
MNKGLALARSGELNELGRQADAERGRALERQHRTQEQGQRIGRDRAARFRASRDDRARALGYADSEGLLRRRYIEDEVPVAELAAALGCAEITVTAEMDRLGIARRQQAERLRLGRDALAAKRAEIERLREARVREVGFTDLTSYMRTRHHEQRWPRKLIAEELGVTVSVVDGLLRRTGVPALRGLRAANAVC